MKSTVIKSVLICLFLAAKSGLFAQVSISIKASQDSFQLGAEIPVELIIRFEDHGNIPGSIRLEVLDSLGVMKYLFPEDSLFSKASAIDFEITDYGSWINNQKNQVEGEDLVWQPGSPPGIFTNKLVLRIWDPGMFRVLITELQYQNSLGEKIIYYPATNEGKTVIIPDPVNTSDTDIAPIDPIIKRSTPWLDLKTVLLILSLLVLIITIAELAIKRRKKEVNWQFPEKPKPPAHDTALRKLKKLQEVLPEKPGDTKKFYSELSLILREYLENRYEFPALESTTDELTKALKQFVADEVQFEHFRKLAKQADLVKFAKAQPAEEQHKECIKMAVTFVENTKMPETKLSSDK